MFANSYERPECPNCGKKTLSTGLNKEQWAQCSKDARNRKLRYLTEQHSDGIYSNIGNKIKRLTVWTFFVEVVVLIILGIFLLTKELYLLSFLAAVVAPVILWISTWFLYAFGQLVQKTCENEQNTHSILEILTYKNNTNQ